MVNYKTYTFSHFVDINPLVRLKANEEYSFVEMKDLNDGQKFAYPSTKRKLTGGARFQDGDTLFARITPCLENGKICQVKNLENGVGFGSTEFLVFRGKQGISDTNFVYYLSRWDEVRRFAELNMVGTSGRQRVPKDVFDNLEIDLPDLQTQIQIASILSSLDNKIELNRRTNQTLEKMAQAVFNEWFVEFNFPGFDGELIKGLPNMWSKVLVSEIASKVQYGFTQSSSSNQIGPKFLRITDIQGGVVDWRKVPYCTITEKEYKKYKVQEHDIFIARTGASTGENIYVINPPDAVFASYLIRVQFENPALSCYVGQFLRSNAYFNYVASILSGSAQPNANAQQLTNIEVILPTSDVLEKFFKVISSINRKKADNDKENGTLAHIRDTLLPKLMSGEIDLSKFETKQPEELLELTTA